MKPFITLYEAAGILTAEMGGSVDEWLRFLENAAGELNLLQPPTRKGMLPGGVVRQDGKYPFPLLRSLGDPLPGDWLTPAATFKQWRESKGLTAPVAAPENPSAREPVQRQVSHEEKILAILKAAGYGPLRLPVAPRGRPNPAKQAAKSKLVPPMTVEVFDKAWQRLRNDRKIQDAEP